MAFKYDKDMTQFQERSGLDFSESRVEEMEQQYLNN